MMQLCSNLKKKSVTPRYRRGGGIRGFLKITVASALVLTLSGCGHILDTMDLRDETVLPAAYPLDNPPPPKINGSIYQDGHEITLYQDHIAGRIGDILTVRLEEATEGQKQAKLKANKTTTTNTNNGTGVDDNGAVKPILFGAAFSKFIFNTGADQQFDGKGETNEFNKLRGTISVTVTRVLSNGNMIIQGESWVTINQGREYIRLTGIVRSEDIEPNNLISSQRIADARISYTGSGQVGNAARGGILTQLMFKFFPY
ncbi:MAG: flagellar basal body L-ring protein FlgH [Gammaproteobacteria bacterium]